LHSGSCFGILFATPAAVSIAFRTWVFLYQVALKLVPKEAEKLGGWGDICPPNPLAASLLFKNGAAAGAQQVLGNHRRRRALGRARPNLAGDGGTRGSHFPALFDYFNLERKPVLDAPGEAAGAANTAAAPQSAQASNSSQTWEIFVGKPSAYVSKIKILGTRGFYWRFDGVGKNTKQ
jgi:hypothetical protein